MGREVSEDRGNESAFGEGALWYDILIPTLVGHKTPPEQVGIKIVCPHFVVLRRSEPACNVAHNLNTRIQLCIIKKLQIGWH